MKPSEFYDNYGSQNIVGGGNTVTERWTKGVNALDTEFGEVSQEAYWLGWIRPENVPTVLKHTKYMYDAEADLLSFEMDNVVSNYPCGYVRADYQYNLSGIYISGENATTFDNRFYNTFFLNDLHPEYSAATGDAIVRLFLIQKDNGEVVPKGITYEYPYVELRFGINASNGTLGDFLEFLNGDNTVTITYGQFSYDINIEDFADGYAEITSNESETRTAIIVIFGYVNPSIFPCNSNNEFATDFALKMSYIDSEDTEIFYNVRTGNRVSVFTPYAYYIDSASVVSLVVNNTGGGLEGEFKISDLNALSATDGYLISGNIFGNKVYGSGGSNPRVTFFHIYTPDEMYKMLALNYRVDVSGTLRPNFSYIDGVTYATDVNSNNEFLARLKTGNISDDEFRDGLRYWQYSSITNNDFDEEDVPPYEPEPEPDDDEEMGSPINRPPTLGVGGTLGFVTQYSLTATQVAALGRILWTSFLDPDYYKNFLFSLALDTGSFNMSSLLTYFISLRVYPFPLINVPSHAAAGSSMFVGAGTVPLAFSDTLHTINNYADYIDAGSLVVPRHYKDFRDYTDAEYMLYLPYCGTVQLNPGDVVGNTLSAQYAIDFATGACIAYVDLRTGDGHGYPIAALPGHIGADVPLTATNAGQVAAMLAGDAMHIAQTIGNVPATQISSGVAGFAAADTGNLAGAANSLIRSWTAPVTAAGQYAQHLATMATRPAIGIPMLSGGRGFGAFGAPQTAYLQIRRGLYKQPDNYAHTVGYASTVSKKIGEAQGLITAYVDTSSLTATADEAAEITALLKSGVIV